MDGLQYMKEVIHRKDVAYFIDPPYTAPGKRAGKRLYRFSEIDHEGLFDMCNQATGDFMMTYDDAESVRNMAEERGFRIEMVPMKNTHHAQVFELLIRPSHDVL
jgi:DNA adenine methylase